MAPPAVMHKTHNLSHTNVLRIDDQHHTLSIATAANASLRPNADSLHAAEAPLHHYHHPNAHITTEVPLHHHAKLNAAAIIAGAVHMAKGRRSVPLLHHQHPVQAIDIEKDFNDVLVSKIGSVAAPQMISRSSIPIHRIDNPTSRQVTFSKRRNGLLKKAYELSVLCDAEVGVIIFSGTGRLYEFASTSMPKLLERYQECSEGRSSTRNLLQDVEFWRHEALLLRDQILRQKNLESYLLGENLLPLDLNEIQNVEHSLELALNKIRFQKVQLLQAEVHERCRHEARLKEDNDLLKRKLSQVTTLHALRGQIDTLAREQECPSASSTFINHGIDEPLKLQLGLELFPTKPAAVSNQVGILN